MTTIYATPRSEKLETVCLLAVLAFVLISFVIGFLLGEDSSGGARGDFYNFHWKAIERFSQMPWRLAVVDYPSATNPLLYMVASLLPLGEKAYRILSTVLAFVIFLFISWAYHRRFSRSKVNWLWALFAASSVLISPSFRSAAFWGNTDCLPFLFSAIASISLSHFQNAPAKNSATKRWRAIDAFNLVVIVVTSSCAFYTRQFYAFVPVIAAWTLLTKNKVSPIVVLGLFTMAMIPELLLLYLWNGINPPTFHNQASPSLSNILLVGANVGFFSIPLIFGSIRRSLSDVLPAWWGLRWMIASFIGLAIFIVTLRKTEWPTFGGGIIVKAGVMMGAPGTPFILSMTYLGLLAVIVFSIQSSTNAVLAGAFLGPFLIAYPLYQRYFDPSFIVALLLFADMKMSAAIFQKRVLTCYFIFSSLLLIVGVVYYR
jgi:hypothetical protein